MRCIACGTENIPSDAAECPNPACGEYLPALLRDFVTPGTLLHDGKYEIECGLGRGGFGITYRGSHRELGGLVAIKEFFPVEDAARHTSTGSITVAPAKRDRYDRWLERFCREGRILAGLDHPGVVRVRDLFRERGTAYLVMDLVRGRTLRAEMDEAGRLPAARVEAITGGLVDALEAVHAAGVFHLDVSPENVLVKSDGTPVLIDFGAARQESGMRSSRAFRQGYAAPELLLQGEVGPQTDLYELAMVVHEMLTGEVAERAIEEDWKPEGIGAPWGELLAAALRWDRKRRPASVREWWNERPAVVAEREPAAGKQRHLRRQKGALMPDNKQIGALRNAEEDKEDLFKGLGTPASGASGGQVDPGAYGRGSGEGSGNQGSADSGNLFGSGPFDTLRVKASEPQIGHIVSQADELAPQHPEMAQLSDHVMRTPNGQDLSIPIEHRSAFRHILTHMASYKDHQHPVVSGMARDAQSMLDQIPPAKAIVVPQDKHVDDMVSVADDIGDSYPGMKALSDHMFNYPKGKEIKIPEEHHAALHHLLTTMANLKDHPNQIVQRAGHKSAEMLDSLNQKDEEPEVRTSKVNPVDGAEMVYVPAGEFLMGDAGQSNNPRRTVMLDAFWIYKTPVTVAQYRRFCQLTRREMPAAPGWGWKEDHPVVNVNWEDAAAYAKWAQAKLPTEAQWEKAARGTDGRRHPWGKDWNPGKLQCSKKGWEDAKSTASVGSFGAGASSYGCLDMAGNVWEWCSDWFDGNYMKNAPTANPTGPATGSSRVLRGGSWVPFIDIYFRCGFRYDYNPDNRYDSHGFRCAVRAD